MSHLKNYAFKMSRKLTAHCFTNNGIKCLRNLQDISMQIFLNISERKIILKMNPEWCSVYGCIVLSDQIWTKKSAPSHWTYDRYDTSWKVCKNPKHTDHGRSNRRIDIAQSRRSTSQSGGRERGTNTLDDWLYIRPLLFKVLCTSILHVLFSFYCVLMTRQAFMR